MTARFAPAISCALVLSACATGYQSQGLIGGFSETQIDTNVWRVTFRGNRYTGDERAENFALLRSAELTLANGFSHFAFADSRVKSDTTAAFRSPTTYQTTGTIDTSGSTSRVNASTIATGGTTTFVSRPSASNVVVMFKGRPDMPAMLYDAAFVCQSLGKKYEVVCNTGAGK